MKNKILLLATTAMLSMGTMAANAGVLGNETVDMPVSIKLITPISLSREATLDFGRIVIKNTSTLIVQVSSSGLTSIETQGYQGEELTSEAYVLDQGHPGLVAGATCDNISLPDADTVSIYKGDTNERRGNMTTLACETVEGKAVIHGKLSLDPAGGYGATLQADSYNGSFTITALYDDYE